MNIRRCFHPQSVIPAAIVLGGLFLVSSHQAIAQSTVTLNFDSVNASTPVDPTTYLASYGITLSSVTPSDPLIYSDQDFYGSGTVQAASGTNFLEQQSAVNGGSFTLNFSAPVSNLSFVEIENLTLNSIGAWSATAYSGTTELSSVSQGYGFGSYSPTTYNLTGSDITSLVISGNGYGSAGISSVMIDNLSYTSSAVPEPSTYAAICGFGALCIAAYYRRSTRASRTTADPSAC